MKNNNKGFILPLLLGIIALLVVGVGVYVYKNKKVEVPIVPETGAQQSDQVQQTNTQTPAVNTHTNNSNSQSDTSNWKTYKNIKYNFEFKYPSDWDLESLDYVPVPQQPSQLGVSVFFKPSGTLILLSINLFNSGAQTEEMINTSNGYFRKLADNGKNVLTAHSPIDFTLNYEVFKQDYETILSTFKFTK